VPIKDSVTTHDVAPLNLRAEVGHVDEEKRTAEIIWTTGSRVKRGGFWSDPFEEELSLDPKHVRMGRIGGGRAPLLNSHRSDSLTDVIGIVESAKLGKLPTAIVRFARDPISEEIFQKVKDGIIRNVSVGYRVYRLELVEEKEGALPVYRATDWEPMELSMVPIGADDGAYVRAGGIETNPCVIVRKQEIFHMPPENEKKEAPAVVDAARAVPPVDVEKAKAEARAEERTRATDIEKWGKVLGRSAEFISEHVRAGTTLENFRELALAAREQEMVPVVADAGRIETVKGGDSRDKWLRGASDWLIRRSATESLVVNYARMKGETVKIDPGEFRGLTFTELARQSLERAGINARGMDKMEVLGKAMTLRTGYNATSDFPMLLEGVLHRIILAAYAIQPDTWNKFAKTGSVSDFRKHGRLRLGSFGRLQKVNEHGEYKNLDLPLGEQEDISADTKGNMVGLTRQMLINDDMNVFSTLGAQLGRMAKRSIELDTYDLLALNNGLGPIMNDGKTLYHADHGNISPAAALSVAALDADRVLMGVQRDIGTNEILDLEPAILLVSKAQGGLAKNINQAQYDIDPGVNAKMLIPNKSAGMFTTIIDTARISGNRRYIFADVAVAPALEVVFLDGKEDPYLETKEGWRIDGVEWKVRLDYGVGAIDYRATVTNAGQ